MPGNSNKNIDISNGVLPERLRRYRLEKNLSPTVLAEKADVTDRTIRDIENGRRLRVQANTIHRLADALGVSYTDLLNGNGSRRYLPWVGVVTAALIAAVLVVLWFVPPPTVGPKPPRPGVTTESPEAYEHYVRGVEALAKVWREEAKTEFQKALELDSTFAMACVRLTHPRIRGTREEARLLILQAQRHAAHVTAREKSYISSRAKFLAGDIDGAIDDLERLTVSSHDERDAFALMGTYYETQKNFENAILCYRKALKIDPGNAACWNQLAYAYHAVGDLEDALDAADHYIALTPSETNPYDTRGDILARSGRPDEAILAYKQALKLRLDFEPSIQSLGCIYLLKQDYVTARSYFEDLMLSHDKGARGRARYFMAAVDLYQGKLDNGMTALNSGLASDRLDKSINENYFHKMHLRARILTERGEFDEAVAQSKLMLSRVRE
ncbi:MAG: tetratricopeptide repeat protein [bacterium]